MNEALPPLPSQVLSASAPRRPFIYGIGGTLVWASIVLAVMGLVGVVVVLALGAYEGVSLSGVGARELQRLHPAALMSVTAIGLTGPVLATIWLAVRRAGQGFAGYLALQLSSRRHAVIGMAAIAGVVLAEDTLTWLMGLRVTSSDLVSGVALSSTPGTIVLMVIALVVATPITEEALFRGFMYRGFAATRLGPIGAVVLSSIIFTALHVQYGALGLTEVLSLGLLLGTMRWLSGSTLLTMGMHALANAVALAEAIVAAGVLGQG